MGQRFSERAEALVAFSQGFGDLAVRCNLRFERLICRFKQ
jgi:hypothetical protein